MKIFDRLLRKKITSEQAIIEFKNCIEIGKSVMREHSKGLLNAAFPENDATELAINIMKREFKRLDKKLTRKEQQLFFKSIYLKCKRDQKFSHHIGHKVDENLVLLIMLQIIDQTTIKEIESAYERDGKEALDRYTKSYQKYYLQLWTLYVLIDVGLKLAYENFFGREIEETLVEQFMIITDDHIAKCTCEAIIMHDNNFLEKQLNLKGTDYDFSNIKKRLKAIKSFLHAVEKDDEASLQAAINNYLEVMENFDLNSNVYSNYIKTMEIN